MNRKTGPISEIKLALHIRELTGLHVAAEASGTLLAILEETMDAIASEAAADARHASRKTIKRADIEKAVATIKRVRAQ